MDILFKSKGKGEVKVKLYVVYTEQVLIYEKELPASFHEVFNQLISQELKHLRNLSE